MQRLKRDLGIELYRKQDAEKKARLYEDKLRHEQTEYQKMQYDFTKAKHDLNNLRVKYDALQLEMTEMQRNPKVSLPPVITMFDEPTQCTPEKQPIRVKRRTDEEVGVERIRSDRCRHCILDFSRTRDEEIQAQWSIKFTGECGWEYSHSGSTNEKDTFEYFKSTSDT